MGKFSAVTMDVLNVNSFIARYKLQEVTSGFLVQRSDNEIDEDGLFSEKIFGTVGTSKRLSTAAYISLSEKVLHPFYYALFKKLIRSFDDILLGYTPFILNENGSIDKATSKNLVGNTNLFSDFLAGKKVEVKDIKVVSGYDLITNHFRAFVAYLTKAKEENLTKGAKKKLKVLEGLSSEKVLIDKFIIIPAGLREINLLDFKQKGILNYPPENDFYIKLIFIAKNNTENSQDFKKYTIQRELDNLHSFFLKDQMAGKRGILKGRSVKKPIAYGSRGVITSNPTKSLSKWDGLDPNNIPVGCIGMPVTMMLSQFYPFFVHHLRKYLTADDNLKGFFASLLESKTHEKYVVVEEIVEVLIDMIVKDHEIGFEKLVFMNTEMAVLDFLRLIAVEIVGTPKEAKRFISGTRYPVIGQYSSLYLLPIPYLTDKYEIKNGIPIAKNLELYSTDVKINTSALPSWVGDFDGDQCSFIGVFSDDANRAIREKAWFRHRNTDINGGIENLFIGNEQLYAMYVLTK